ncbi:glutamate 5-kinase [bacterium]|jgi:glutamate 5-kinase|nr:glutamate 5-kinase [bacterium]
MLDIVRQEVVRSADLIIVKIGTNVLSRADGTLDREHLAHLAGQVSSLRAAGKHVAIVSSGAVGAGVGKLKLGSRPGTLPELQAAAAVGQAELIRAYDDSFRSHGCHAAQILVTAEDFDNRTRYLNVRNTIHQLIDWNAVPIINENDTVSTDEMRFGDNDRLAALVTNLLRAPLLIILSVVDGLYRGDPRGPNPELIDLVLDLNDDVLKLAHATKSDLGTGGMKSKLDAARIATTAGESVWIANGRAPDILKQIIGGEKVGTLFPARGESLTSWKRWIGYSVRPRGLYVVDKGAKDALVVSGSSLLPIGVVGIDGDFEKGDVVSIATEDGDVFARGLSNYRSQDARVIRGLPTGAIRGVLGHAAYAEAIHRDNLVVLHS